MCGYWRCFFRAMLTYECTAYDPPYWAWGGLPHRRREAAIAIPRMLFWKAKMAKLSCVGRSHDLTNAFACGMHARRINHINEFAPPHLQPLLRQRRTHLRARLRAFDNDIWVYMGCGGPMGCSSEP